MSAATGTDWTRILSDPDLVRHVGALLQAYREAPAGKREEALLLAMRQIKAGSSPAAKSAAKSAPAPQPVPTPTSTTPPFAPDLFSPSLGSDRRRNPAHQVLRGSRASGRRHADFNLGQSFQYQRGWMSGGNGQPGQARSESGNRPVGAEWKDLGERVCAERRGHAQRTRERSSRPFRGNGADRTREFAAVREVRAGDDPGIAK